MTQKQESKFWRDIKPLIEALPNTFVERITQVSIRGTPDVLMCVNSWFVALELKKSKKDKPDKLQTHKLENIRKASGVALVCCPENWPLIYEFLKELAGSK